MKKISAFAAFKAKKGDTPTLERGDASRGSIKKASSTPAINGEEKKPSKLLKTLKGGSFRKTIRGNKHRPTSVSETNWNSPFVAGDSGSVELTSLKDNSTPTGPKSNKGSTSSPEKAARSKQKKPLPPLPNTDMQETPKNGPKRQIDRSPDKSQSKRQRTASPVKNGVENGETSKVLPVQPVSPQKKDKGSKQKVWQGVTLQHMYDSQEEASKLFECMIHPVPVDKFFKELWEKKPLLVRRHNETYNEGWFSTAEFDKILKEQHVEFGVNLDVTSYKDGKRETHYPAGRAYRPVVWDFYQTGCSLRLLNPQSFSKSVWKMLSVIQEYFGCCVGANVYLTPPGTQGFAPHYDDIEAFILQLEGKKHWKLYNPRHIMFALNNHMFHKNNLNFSLSEAMVKHYQDFQVTGCSLRLLNPQSFSKSVWKMLSVIQEYFGCCVGANVYLTPPGTQGFAPHYDDIEAFILQLEGKKHWKLYNPRSDGETLPRFSSGNFTDEDIGSPILDITLEAGDLLYFPRGTIHQANASEDAHSLHITFSCYQKNSWGDLLETLIPRALGIAMEEDVEFRQGLPVNFLNYMGLVNSDIESPQRESFIQKISGLMTKLVQDYLPIDAACDQMGKKFIHDSLPPVLNEGEKSCSVHGHGEHWDPTLKSIKGVTEIEPDTMIKLIRKGVLRLVTENDEVRVYHNLENSRVYHEKDPQYIDITPEMAPAVEHLVHNYPDYVSVDSLPPPTVEERVEIASLLYDKGLIVSGEPLDAMYEDSDTENS